jgi:cysteine desulfurase
MGYDNDRALSALRLSLGRWTTAADVGAAATAIAEAARRLVITSLDEHCDAGVAAG